MEIETKYNLGEIIIYEDINPNKKHEKTKGIITKILITPNGIFYKINFGSDNESLYKEEEIRKNY